MISWSQYYLNTFVQISKLGLGDNCKINLRLLWSSGTTHHFSNQSTQPLGFFSLWEYLKQAMEEQFRSFRTLSTKTDIKLSSSEFVVLFHKTLERLQPIKLRIEYNPKSIGSQMHFLWNICWKVYFRIYGARYGHYCR